MSGGAKCPVHMARPVRRHMAGGIDTHVFGCGCVSAYVSAETRLATMESPEIEDPVFEVLKFAEDALGMFEVSDLLTKPESCEVKKCGREIPHPEREDKMSLCGLSEGHSGNCLADSW